MPDVPEDFDLAFPEGRPERRWRPPGLRQLLRRRLTWLVLAECVVVAAFGVAAWHVVQSRLGARPPELLAPLPDLAPIPEVTPPSSGAGAGRPGAAGRSGAGPTPGLRRDAGFVNRLNSDDAAWAAAQWRLSSAVITWARAYIKGVIVPAVERAAHRPAAPRASPTPQPGHS